MIHGCPVVIRVLLAALLVTGCDTESPAGDDATATVDDGTADTGATGDGDGDGDGDATSGDGDGDGDTTSGDGDGDGDGDGCVPVSDTETVCDGLDDDCNGVVDDVDIGNDGFCDCYSIGIIGNPGVNPSSDFDTWLNVTGTSVTRIGTDAAHELTASELASFDIVILDRLTHAYSADEAAVLASFVDSGRGLITMAGYANNETDRVNQSSLLRSVGLQAVAPIFLNPTEVWTDHEITAGAEAVQFYGGWGISALDGEALGEVLLRAASDSTVLGVAKEHGDGRAFVYGDEWISFDSEWQAIPGVTTLWQNAIRWVGPKDFCFPIVE